MPDQDPLLNELDTLAREDHAFSQATVVRAMRKIINDTFDRSTGNTATALGLRSLIQTYVDLTAGIGPHREGHDLESAREVGWLTGQLVAARPAWGIRGREGQRSAWRIGLMNQLLQHEATRQDIAWTYGVLAGIDGSWAPAWAAREPTILTL